MINTFAAIGLGAVVALAPLAAHAETYQLAQVAAAPAATSHTPTGSHRSQMRHRSNLHKEQARAGAEHMRKMRHPPATAAPKS
jgi:hypothetical protein